MERKENSDRYNGLNGKRTIWRRQRGNQKH